MFALHAHMHTTAAAESVLTVGRAFELLGIGLGCSQQTSDGPSSLTTVTAIASRLAKLKAIKVSCIWRACLQVLFVNMLPT